MRLLGDQARDAMDRALTGGVLAVAVLHEDLDQVQVKLQADLLLGDHDVPLIELVPLIAPRLTCLAHRNLLGLLLLFYWIPSDEGIFSLKLFSC